MFGTIGRYRVKPGHEENIRALIEEWQQTMRPKIPGLVINLRGRRAENPAELVGVILTQDEKTYRAFAASPEQDAWYQRLREHLEAEPTWDDVSWETLSLDSRQESS